MTENMTPTAESRFAGKIVFFGSTNLGLPILEALMKDHQIVGVVTTPDAKAGRKQELQETPISSLAKDLNLNLYKPESLKNNPDFLELIKNLNADLFVLVAYGKILPNEYLNLPQYKILNLHPSVLPKYRGPSPIRTALLNGDEQTGVTFIILDEQVDHGPIVAQKIVDIDLFDNDFTLTDKLSRTAASIVNQVIADYVSGAITPLPQDDSAASFTKQISKADGKIDWSLPSNSIYNQFRAYYPWPGIWTTWNGKKIKILDCVPTENGTATTENYGNGQVLQGGVVVCGNDTYLKIKTLQLEGKNETDIDSFLNGYKDFIGAKLD
jgi:methionyl-tRNA formyltransferase